MIFDAQCVDLVLVIRSVLEDRVLLETGDKYKSYRVRPTMKVIYTNAYVGNISRIAECHRSVF